MSCVATLKMIICDGLLFLKLNCKEIKINVAFTRRTVNLKFYFAEHRKQKFWIFVWLTSLKSFRLRKLLDLSSFDILVVLTGPYWSSIGLYWA